MEIEQKQRMLLKPGERIDCLLWHNFQIIQNKDWFCFGLDAVLLADFAQVAQGELVLDLCTGNGIIPLLLAAKEEGALITGVELFPEVVEMAGRSVRLNGVENRIKMITGDICQISDFVPAHHFPVVTVNPPYRKKQTGKLSSSPLIAAAKAEVYCELSQVVGAIAYSLATAGRFYLVYPYERLMELLDILQCQSLQVTCLVLIKNFSKDKPFLCLVSGSRNGQADNRLEQLEKREFVVFRQNQVYTEEMEAIFRKYQRQ